MNKKNIDKQPRNPIFDLLRIILTILVINVHIRIITGIKLNFLEPYTWYTVPLFIVLSFFLSNNRSLKERVKRLFIPFIFWSIIGFIIHPDLISFKNIYLQLLTGHVVNTPLYYLVLLILFSVINWFISRLSSNLKIFIYSLIVFVVLCLEYSKINYNFFSPMITVIEKSYGRFIELIKFMPVGLVFGYLNKKIINKKFFLILSCVFLVIFFAISNIPVLPDFHFSGLKTLTGSIVIFAFVLWISNLKTNIKLSNAIYFFGKYSFGVYLSHYLLLEIVLKINPSFKLLIYLNQILFLLFYTLICYLFCFLFDLLTFRKFSFLIK